MKIPDDDVETAPLLSSARGTGRLKPSPQSRIDEYDEGPRLRVNATGATQAADAASFHGGDDDSTFESFPQIRRREAVDGRKLRLRIGWKGRFRTSVVWAKIRLFRLGERCFYGRNSDDNGGGAAVIDSDPDDPLGREYYLDAHNEHPSGFSCGTSEGSGIWMNTSDQAGTLMSFSVWLALIYGAFTVVLVSEQGRLPPVVAMTYCTICTLALASHAKTSFTDPGSVPKCAVPVEDETRQITFHAMCSQCQSFKPQNCHHCRICDRCVSRMDHHCPWMNNCIGAANLKHFILFLIYTWIASGLALVVFALNYFLCHFFHRNVNDGTCQFSPVLQTLVRGMTVVAISSLLFVSSMIVNVAFGLVTGTGTIDRMKRNAGINGDGAEPAPLHPEDVFGMGPVWTWPLPIDPVFRDHDAVLGFSTPQRLLRERLQLGDVGCEGHSDAGHNV
uniref:Palmitoyltransferase n=1 Tax=Odontella aurita TaxID=265563 RepID=A0A7S4N8L5_9STRA|mmetsp:Transcript_52204/g.156685  ORF Transcript_52204/g.156685 Transcript_52204/m.156685 type:complete len:447 (+) Transcript_52204:107-1447(+)